LEKQDEAWVLTTTSSFKADYIRAHFSQALERAAEHVGLAHRPDVRMRKSDKP
jgi:hypothetical protein